MPRNRRQEVPVVIFTGVNPWELYEPFVELETSGRIIDLHNCSKFLGFSYTLPGELGIRFLLDPALAARSASTDKTLVELRFDGVEEFRVDEAEREAKYEADTLSDIIYRKDAEGREMVEVSFMDGLRLKFRASAVSLNESPRRHATAP